MGSVNAFNGKAVGVAVEADTAKSVTAKFEAARKAQPAWAAAGLAHRHACVQRFQGLIETHADELAALLSAEVGKPLPHAKGEIMATLPRIQFFLDNVEKHMVRGKEATKTCAPSPRTSCAHGCCSGGDLLCFWYFIFF
jgi:acyl-CoA reductase-like NAD-dependent aldehyde dehydrogenase